MDSTQVSLTRIVIDAHTFHYFILSVFEILEDLCDKDTEALVKCYKDDADAVTACASCAWEPLHREGLTYGAACDSIKEVVEEDYDHCADCKSECVNEVHLLEGCGIGLFCDEVPNIKLA